MLPRLAALKLSDPPASASGVWGLKVCTTLEGLAIFTITILSSSDLLEAK